MTSRWFLVASLFVTCSSLAQPRAGFLYPRVVTVSPACPEMANKTRTYKLPVIRISYDPSALGAMLRSPHSLTLHIAAVDLPSQATVYSQPLTRQADGTWATAFDPPSPFGWGYFVFYFEDGQHRVDNNGGVYWSIVSCLYGEPNVEAVIQESNSWLGQKMASGMQRPLNRSAAIAVLRSDLARYPGHLQDYYILWTDESAAADKSPASYKKVDRQINDYLSKHGDDYNAMMQIAGFVAANQAELSASTVERFRKAAIALPQTAEAFVWAGPHRKHAVPRNAQWIRRMERDVHKYILADLDFWPIRSETDLRKQAEDFLAYAAEYPDSRGTGDAYLAAMQDEENLKDLAGVENVEAKMSAWDPKNPDPPAVLAHYYLKRKIKLKSALDLLDRAVALFDAAVPANADPSSRKFYGKGIKSNGFVEAAPTPSDRWKLLFLRGKVYFLLNKLPQARVDLESAAKAMPDKPEVQFALGQVLEKVGDRSQALDAYLAAASASYGSTEEARAAYERLFVEMKLGSRKAADARLFARIRRAERQDAAKYVPVELNKTAPAFSFQTLNGRTFDNRAARGRVSVINFWSVWCAPCTVELPGLLKFQKSHPKVDFIAVAIDKKPGEVRDYLASHGLSELRAGVAPEIPLKLASLYPTTIVLGKSGQVQFVHDGFLPDAVAILDKDLDALHSR